MVSLKKGASRMRKINKQNFGHNAVRHLVVNLCNMLISFLHIIDQWPSLLLSSESPRTEMIYNIDPGSPNSREEEER